MTAPTVSEPLGQRAGVNSISRGMRALIVVALAGVVAAGAWGIFVDRGAQGGAGGLAAVHDVVAIPGGEMRIDSVLPWADETHKMPGMPMPDPVPEGKRRLVIDVTLRAKTDSRLRYIPDSFTVAAPRLPSTKPYWATPGLEMIVPGAQATVTLIYQVPEEAKNLVLSLGGASERVALEGSADAAGTGQDHRDEDHDHAEPGG